MTLHKFKMGNGNVGIKVGAVSADTVGIMLYFNPEPQAVGTIMKAPQEQYVGMIHLDEEELLQVIDGMSADLNNIEEKNYQHLFEQSEANPAMDDFMLYFPKGSTLSMAAVIATFREALSIMRHTRDLLLQNQQLHEAMISLTDQVTDLQDEIRKAEVKNETSEPEPMEETSYDRLKFFQKLFPSSLFSDEMLEALCEFIDEMDVYPALRSMAELAKKMEEQTKEPTEETVEGDIKTYGFD